MIKRRFSIHIRYQQEPEDESVRTHGCYSSASNRVVLFRLDLSYLRNTEVIEVLSRYPPLQLLSLSHFDLKTKLASIVTTTKLCTNIARWSLPRLRTLDISNILPSFVVGQGLTKIEFEIGTLAKDPTPLDITALHRVLKSCPCLIVLCLTFTTSEDDDSICAGQAAPTFVTNKYTPIQLTRLTTVSLTVISPSYEPYSPPTSFLPLIKMPNLQSMDLRLNAALVRTWFPALSIYDLASRRFNCLSLLTMELIVTDDGVNAGFVFDTVSVLPKLRRLVLERDYDGLGDDEEPDDFGLHQAL